MRVVIFPENGYFGDKWLSPAMNDWHIGNHVLKNELEQAGYEVCVWPCEVDKDKDLGIYFDSIVYPHPVCEKSLYIALEPPVVIPRFYERLAGWPYKRILTFCRAFVDETRVFWSPYPILRYKRPLKGSHERNLCAITSNKGSNHSHALYNARRQAYLAYGPALDLAGKGWLADQEMCTTVNVITEPIQDKVQFLSHYKAALVIENQEIEGYCSEKYWDCIQAGTYPVYRGWYPDYTLDDCDERAFAKRILTHIKAIG